MTAESTDDLPDGVASRKVNKLGVIEYRDAEGQFHCPDGPALICPDRATYWLVTGEDPYGMPDWWFTTREWWRHGKLHRTDGPAVDRVGCAVEYWVNGRRLTQKEFDQSFPGVLNGSR